MRMHEEHIMHQNAEDTSAVYTTWMQCLCCGPGHVLFHSMSLYPNCEAFSGRSVVSIITQHCVYLGVRPLRFECDAL